MASSRVPAFKPAWPIALLLFSATHRGLCDFLVASAQSLTKETSQPQERKFWIHSFEPHKVLERARHLGGWGGEMLYTKGHSDKLETTNALGRDKKQPAMTKAAKHCLCSLYIPKSAHEQKN